MKKGMMKKLAIILSALTLSCGILGIIPMLQKNVKVEAAGTTLTFNSDNWTVESGALSDGNLLSVTGEGKTLIHSNQTYENFHLTYKTQYSSSSTSGDPWYGRSGVILRSENSGADGFYLGFYGWDNLLWASTGNFVDNAFYHMNGVDAGWGAVGFNEHVIDLYVYGSSCNIIINGWLFQNVPMPYDASGHISIISEGVTATYGDFYIEELADDFDYASLITRANWSGNNFSGEQWYWYESGKDQSFRMKLPDDLTGITKYFLARTSKVFNDGQSVDVLIDKTGTKTASDDWGEKAFTWGDYNGAKAGSFATNIVAFDPSVFEGVAGGSTVGFYLDKNQDGWYSANNYWLLYEKNGKIYVADYFDLVYGFDRDAHAYAWANANNYIRGYWFIRQEDLSLISFARGEEAVFVQNPVMTKIKNVEYTFAENEGEKTLDMSEYISVVKKGIGYTLSYAVDGVQVDSVVLAPATKSGVITVTCSADGNSINNGGTVGFTPIVVEIPYSTVLTIPEGSLVKKSDISVNVTKEGETLDLLEYVETDIEGAWSYTYGGETFQGTILSLNYASSSQELVLTVTPSNGGAAKSVTLSVNVTAYSYPAPVSLPYFMDENASGFNVLNGEPYKLNGKWVADASHSWSVMADLGTDAYTLQVQSLVGAGATVGTYGVLLQASIGQKGLNGLLVGFEEINGGLFINTGWYENGKYTPYFSTHTGFGSGTEYLTTFIVDGSFVQLTVNGWRILNFQNKYTQGTCVAILNNGNVVSYRELQVYAFNDYAGDYVIRTQWNGIDTYAKLATLTGSTSITFDLIEGASNYRLVSRTDIWMGAQSARVSVNEADKGVWEIEQGQHHTDAIYQIGELSGEYVTIGITPVSGNFRSMYAWLICEKDGKDYIADCVYFGHDDDLKAHNVVGEYTVSGVDKRFICTANKMLLTFAKGEEVIWAREESVLDKMQALTYSNANISSSVNLPYRLYLPENYDESKEYPLLVFMHGAGERGNDNMAQISVGAAMGTEYLVERIILGEYADKFIIVAPQCPLDMRWVERDWENGGYDFNATAQSLPSKLLESLLYDDIFANYSVDRSRVYGAGLSMGGFGVTDLAMRNPDLFAAIVNCAGGCDASQFELLATTALRAWHSEGDGTVKNDELLTLVNNMQSAGLEARYTEVNNNGHLSWLVAFEDPDLIPWLLAHEKTWTVSVEANGGVFEQVLPDSYDKTLEEIVLQAPTKEGFKFDGWYLDEEFTNPITSISGATALNVKLHAKWIKSVTVVIKDGETVLQTLNGFTGDVIDLAEYKPAKEGYLFLGWSDGENDISSTSSITLSEDLTLSAKWVVIEYLVKIFDGETEVYGASVAHGGSVDFVPEEKVGWTFVGYYSDSELSQKTDLPTVISSNITLYLAYELNTYVITVNAYEGFVSSQTVMHGETFVPETPVREGYNFIGWYTDAECTIIYEEGAVTEAFEIFAKWEEIPAINSSNELVSCSSSLTAIPEIASILALIGFAFVCKKRK